jgi:lipoate-protein ligase A
VQWTYGQTPQLTFSVPPPDGAAELLEGAPLPPEGVRFSITANKGVVEKAESELECMQGLVGLRFDGGVINDHISTFGDAPEGLGEWIEGVLGRTEWGESAE